MAAGAMARAVSWLWGGLGLLALGLAWEAGHRAFGPFVLPALALRHI